MFDKTINLNIAKGEILCPSARKHIRHVNVILWEEEMYISFLQVPKVKYDLIYSIVKNELQTMFNNIENLLFDFKIYNTKKDKYEVALYCLNYEWSLLNSIVGLNTKIISVVPVQYIVFEFINKRIADNNYIAVFFTQNGTYMLGIAFKNLVYNCYIKNVDSYIMKEKISEILNKLTLLGEKKDEIKIYYLTDDKGKFDESMYCDIKDVKEVNIKKIKIKR